MSKTTSKLFSRTNPLSLGILQIGIGGKKIRFLDDTLSLEIFEEITRLKFDFSEKHIQLFAFLGAFLIKQEYSQKERLLLQKLCCFFATKSSIFIEHNHAEDCTRAILHYSANYYFSSIFQYYQSFFVFLLKATPILPDILKEITEKLLYRLNPSITNSTNQESTHLAKAFFMSNIRYRYTSIEEYKILYDGLVASLSEEHPFLFSDIQHISNRPNIILSEPFDGVNRTYLITPLIAKFFFNQGFMPIQLTGNSSGPKFICNVLDISKLLKQKSIQNVSSFNQNTSKLYLDISKYSMILENWRYIRRFTLKRPFLSTIEKFPRLFQSTWFISSVFHDNYIDIMLSLAEHAGYLNIIIIKNGREGSLAFSLSKPVEVFLSKKQDNHYIRHQFSFSLMDCDKELENDGRCSVTVNENVAFIKKIDRIEKMYEQDVTFLEKDTILKNLLLSENEYKSGLRFLLTQAGSKKIMEYF